MTEKTKEQLINLLFNDLFNECCNEGNYSARETAEKMGMNYDQMLEWAKGNEWREDILDTSSWYCAGHAELDGLLKKLDPKKAHKYRLEGDKEYAEYFHTVGKYLPEFADVITNKDMQSEGISIKIPLITRT